MRDASKVAVCCPGPSFSVDQIPDDFEVASVNQTLKDLPRCRWWIAYDAPNDVHDQCVEKFREFRPTIVTLPERFEAWRTWFRDRIKLADHDHPSFELCDFGPLWYKVAIKTGPMFTSLVVISWALRRRVRELKYIGADMNGDGYYDSRTTELERNARKRMLLWNNRWASERKHTRAGQEEAFKRGYMRITGLPWDDPPIEFP